MLLTRLREESFASAVRLRRRGWSVVRAPLLSLEALPAPDFAEKLEQKPALVVTSKSALRTLSRTHAFKSSSKSSFSPLQRSAIGALSIYAVGEESAAFAKRIGFASVRAAQGTLASLIEEIRQHHPPGAPVLHLCGRHRRGNLVESLRKMGYPACRSVLYEAVSARKLPVSAYNILLPAMHPSLYASLFYSPRTADIFATLYAQTFGEPSMLRACLRFFCLAPSIGVRLRQRFPCARIVCAVAPSESSLFQALDEVST